VKNWIPEIETLHISPDGTTILGSDGHSLGTTPGRAFKDILSGGRDPRVTGIGPATLRRALITRMAEIGRPVDFSQPALGVVDDGRLPLFGEDTGGGNDSGPILRSGESGNETGTDLATGALYSAPAQTLSVEPKEGPNKSAPLTETAQDLRPFPNGQKSLTFSHEATE